MSEQDVKLGLVLDHYLVSRKVHGYSEPAGEVEAELVAESEDGITLRVIDGKGAWYFRQAEDGTVEWLARVHPGTFATCPSLARVLTPAVAKATDWVVERWDAILGLVSKQGTEGQSLVLSKERVGSADAAKYRAGSHGFSFGDVDETENSYRLRQFDPDSCSTTPKTISLDTGVQAVICVRKSVEKHTVEPDPMMTGRHFRVVRTEDEKQFALGVVYGGDDQPDAHGDTMTADEVERAAWSAVARGLKVGLEHEDGTTGVGT